LPQRENILAEHHVKARIFEKIKQKAFLEFLTGRVYNQGEYKNISWMG
jgi:hypothetical protein